MTVPRCLTIAGSDSGGGAGIQADLKAFAAAGCHGMTAIVALTAQNTVGVVAVEEASPAFVRAQLEAVFSDLGVDAAKTGMLFSAPIIETVADFLASHPVPLVVDPVMVASSGARLLREDAVETLVTRLLPLATVITPNLLEAETLAGGPAPRAELERRGLVRGIEHDAAQLDHGLVVTQDALVEGVHFRLDRMTWRDLGFRAAAVNLSDLAASGAVPECLVVTLGVPATTDVEAV